MMQERVSLSIQTLDPLAPQSFLRPQGHTSSLRSADTDKNETLLDGALLSRWGVTLNKLGPQRPEAHKTEIHKTKLYCAALGHSWISEKLSCSGQMGVNCDTHW